MTSVRIKAKNRQQRTQRILLGFETISLLELWICASDPEVNSNRSTTTSPSLKSLTLFRQSYFYLLRRGREGRGKNLSHYHSDVTPILFLESSPLTAQSEWGILPYMAYIGTWAQKGRFFSRFGDK